MKNRKVFFGLFTLMLISIFSLTGRVEARINPVISNVNVYSNKITGRTEPYATVSLYDGYSYIRQERADYNGDFEIKYDFKDYYRYDNRYYNNGYYNNYYYYDGYGNGKSTTVTSNSYSNRVEGYGAYSSSLVIAYDKNNNEIGRGYSNSRGEYDFTKSIDKNVYEVISYDYYDYNYGNYYNPWNDYNWKYDRDNRYYRDFYLVSEKDGYSSDRYYLNNDYRNRYSDSSSAVITDAKAETIYISGYGVDSYAGVTVKDENGYTLGETSADSSGRFTIYTNRTLKAGEKLSVIARAKNSYRDASVTYTVEGKKVEDKGFNYKNEFTIGSKTFTQVVDGVSLSKTIDVEPYIQNGRTMLPMRYVAESLGYVVTWNPGTRNASFSDGKDIIIINVDSAEFFINGIKHTFNVEPEVVDGRTMLPVSEIGKALGLSTGNKGDNKNIEWDAANRTVLIQKNK